MNENEARKQLAVFDSLLNELATAAADPKSSPAEFFRQFDKVVESIVGPKHFAIVAAGPRHSLLPIHSNPDQAPSIASWVEAEFASDDGPLTKLKPKSRNILVNPIELATRTWGWIITVFPEDGVSPAYQEILSAISQIVAEFLTARQLAQQTELRNQFQRYSNNVHASLNPHEVAQHIANDARMLMNCERVSVYAGRQQRPKLFAVSAVATIENRSDLMRGQQKLVSAAARLQQPIGSDQPPADEGLRSLLESYQEQSGFPFLFCIPLEANNGIVG
jgi:hypothetical protein